MLVADGEGGAFVGYQGQEAIYTQRITSDGYWGYPCPEIYSVIDIPGDEGGEVNLSWYASRLDYGPDYVVSYYSIWRAIEEEAAMMAIGKGARVLNGTNDISDTVRPGTIRIGEFLGDPYFWQLIGTVTANRIETYAEPVPTLFDSTALSDDNHYFQLIAHTSDPLIFWTSEPDSGYSVDNLAPCPPLGLAGEQQYLPEGILVLWDPNSEGDLHGYNVYRGLSGDFEPGPGNLIASPCDTFTFDGDWRWDSGYYYKVGAVDIHGNESQYALLGPGSVTGDDTPSAPDTYFLSQNQPNPFNPMTTVRFGIAEPTHVTLSIYDTSGRLVRVLIDGRRPANRYETIWDGCDASGRQVASGVYFYKLKAGEFIQSKKMVLLR
jgi:hypothetical protein